MVNNKNYNNISIIILYIVVSFLLTNSIFFYIFGNVSVDTVIALSLLLLFYLFYFFGNRAINSYLYNQTKAISLFFSKLLYLTLSLRMLLISFNKSYFYFLKYKVVILNYILSEVNFQEVKINLMKCLNINKLYKLLILKFNYILAFNKYVNKYNNYHYNYNISIINFKSNDFLIFFSK
jgi:hypothetical protein